MTTQEKNDQEICEFLAAVVQRSVALIEQGKLDVFDVQFEFKDKKYRLQLIEDSETSYLKEN